MKLYSTGEKIKQYRKQKGMTQKQLSEKLGISNSMLSNYENGSSALTLDFLYKIIEALELTDDEKLDILGLSDLVDKYKNTYTTDKTPEGCFTYKDFFCMILDNYDNFKNFEIAVIDNNLCDYIDIVGMLDEADFSKFEKELAKLSYNNARKIIQGMDRQHKRAYLEAFRQNDFLNVDDMDKLRKIVDTDEEVNGDI